MGILIKLNHGGLIIETPIKKENYKIRNIYGACMIVSGWLLLVINHFSKFGELTQSDYYIQIIATINVIIGIILIALAFLLNILYEDEERRKIDETKIYFYTLAFAVSFINFFVTAIAVNDPLAQQAMYLISWLLYAAGIIMVMLILGAEFVLKFKKDKKDPPA